MRCYRRRKETVHGAYPHIGLRPLPTEKCHTCAFRYRMVTLRWNRRECIQLAQDRVKLLVPLNMAVNLLIPLNLNSVNQLKCGVLFEVRTGFLNNI
jgi:hypothetical protein